MAPLWRLVLLLAAAAAAAAAAAGRDTGPFAPTLDVDWPAFLARADPVWKFDAAGPLPSSWGASAFVGDGLRGAMLSFNGSALRVELGRTDVYDDRQPGAPYYTGNFVYDQPVCARPSAQSASSLRASLNAQRVAPCAAQRLPIGRFFLPLVGSLDSGWMRLSLWDATVTGEVLTSTGAVQWTAYLHAEAGVLALEVAAQGGETAALPALQFEPANASSSWAPNDPSYVFNPPPRFATLQPGDASVCSQPLLSGNCYATAYAWRIAANGASARLLATVSGVGDCNDTAASAAAAVAAFEAGNASALAETHAAWWHAEYPASFVSVNDSVLEGFYWIQVYKLAAATRSDRAPIDLQGPWMVEGTVWPDLHWDLNVQLAYSPLYTANRLSLASSLLRFLDAVAPNLALNVPTEWRNDSAQAPSAASSLQALETCYWDYGPGCLSTPPTITGNLLWACNLYWRHWRFSQDRSVLAALFPLLRRAVNAYRHFQVEGGGDGLVHLPETFSPEYPYRGPDTNYDLALYRWALAALADAAGRLGIADPLLPEWQRILAQLAPYPTSADDGYMVAAGVPLNVSHRHFSHLLMLFPLTTTNLSDASERALAQRSFDHWVSLGPDAWTGFALAGAASMSLLLGRPEAGLGNLTELLLGGLVLPNTMYGEDGDNPCIETPLAAASALQDALLLSCNGVVRVFAGAGAAAVADAAFFRLRADGAFLVSAARVAGVTQFVVVEREAGDAPCLIATDLAPPLVARPAGTVSLRPLTLGSDTVWALEGLAPGAAALILSSHNPNVSAVVAPVAGDPALFNYWGLH
jgi:hypothetical protein